MTQHTSRFSPVLGTCYPVKERSQAGLMWLAPEKSTSVVFAFYPADAYEVVNNSQNPARYQSKSDWSGLFPSTTFSLSFCCLLFSGLLGSPLPPSFCTQRWLLMFQGVLQLIPHLPLGDCHLPLMAYLISLIYALHLKPLSDLNISALRKFQGNSK